MSCINKIPEQTASLSLHQVCDQCYSRKIKCDRQAPTCDQCSLRQDSCGYTRLLKRKPNLARESNFQFKTSTLFLEGDTCEYIANSPPKTASNKKPLSFGPVADRHRKRDLPNQSVFRVFKAVAHGIDRPKRKRSFLKKQLSSLGPSFIIDFVGSTWINFWLSLTGLDFSRYFQLSKGNINSPLKTLALPTSPTNIGLLNPTCNLDPGSSALISRAFDAYFSFINPYVPLFSKEGFFSVRRSLLLTTVILASGLRLLPPQKYTQALINRYLIYIKQSISPFSIKISIDYLQAILVIYVGLQGLGFSLKMAWISNGFSIDLAHMLGLHLPYNNQIGKRARLERHLAYSVAHGYDTQKGLFLSVPGMLSASHSGSRFSLIDVFVVKRSEDFPTFSLLIVSEFDLHLSSAFQKLTWLKYRINASIIKPIQVRYAVNEVIQIIERAVSIAIWRLNLFNPFFKDKSVLEKAERLSIHFRQNFFYSKLKAISLLFLPTAESGILKDFSEMAVDTVQSLVSLNEQLDCDLGDPDRIYSLIHAAVFLLRHSKYITQHHRGGLPQDWAVNTVGKIVTLFRRLEKLEPFNARATFFIAIIDLSASTFNASLALTN